MFAVILESLVINFYPFKYHFKALFCVFFARKNIILIYTDPKCGQIYNLRYHDWAVFDAVVWHDFRRGSKSEFKSRWLAYQRILWLFLAADFVPADPSSEWGSVNRPLESTGVVVRLLTQGPRSASPLSSAASRSLSQVFVKCGEDATLLTLQASVELPAEENPALCFVFPWHRKKKKSKAKAFPMQSGVALDNQPR